MPPSIIQTAKNQSAYQVQPLTVTLPAGTTSGSYTVVVVEAQKSGYPYNPYAAITSYTPSPIVTDDKGNVYTLVDRVVGVTQELTDAALSPDASGYYPSAYVYVSSAAAVTGTRNILVGAFYPDDYTSPLQSQPSSPPTVNGRPVFDGGLQAQVFEVSGMSSGVDVHGNTTSAAAALGHSLITTSTTSLIIEVGLLIDSASIISATGSTQQFSSIIVAGSSHTVVQSTAVTGATASSGFANPLLYTGAVVAVSLK